MCWRKVWLSLVCCLFGVASLGCLGCFGYELDTALINEKLGLEQEKKPKKKVAKKAEPKKKEPKKQATAAQDKGEKLEGRREATLRFVWVAERGGKYEGGTAPVTLRVEPNKSGQVAVGVVEEFAGGAGDMMRAASWIAAFIATQSLGERLGDYEFMVRAGGYVDGPSASLLIGAGMMALIRGATPRADTTMTGALMPNGASGPVGGIVQKMRGAKAAGIKRFGYPAGSRQHLDPATGQRVDLEAVGKELGLQVRELRDVFEAYEWLTGDKIARPAPAAEADMSLDAALAARLTQRNLAMSKAALQRIQAARHNIQRADGRVVASVMPTVTLMNQSLEQASRFDEQGQHEASYGRIARASMLAGTINTQLLMLDAISKANWVQLNRQLSEMSRAGEGLRAVEVEIVAKLKQRTLGGRINATYAVMTYLTAEAFARHGAAMINEGQQIAAGLSTGKVAPTQKNVEVMLTALLVPTVYIAAAEALIYAARLQLALGAEEGSARADDAEVRRMARAYQSAAQANLSYLDALVTRRQPGLLANEHSYSLAVLMAGAARRDLSGASDALLDTSALASGAYSYMATSELIFKYYSLDARLKPDGSVELTNRAALGAQLDLARARALEAAGRCKKELGFIPAAARTDYSGGLALRDGSDEDKLEALSSLWMSAFWSDLAITVGAAR